MSCRLDCVVQHYEWGDRSAIPQLLGTQPDGRPHAELWMGAHPSAPSCVDGQRLDDLIARDPVGFLGEDVAETFGELPFLFKVLAADQPLSLQVHPSAAQAVRGFEREEAAGVALDAPERTYRDPHSKPEILCALSEFEAKCGFRTAAEALAVLGELRCHELDPVRHLLRGPAPMRSAFVWLLRLDVERARELVHAVASAALSIDPRSVRAREFRTCVEMAERYPGDVGVVVGLLLHHIVLRPGQAVFVRPGLLHGYVRGVGIELMGNSDNVVRCGLTTKHLDVAEALALVDVTPATPPVETPDRAVYTFDTPVPEFSLTRIERVRPNVDIGTGAAGRTGPSGSEIVDAAVIEGPAIVVATDGVAELEGHGELTAGRPVLVRAADGACRLTVRDLDGRGALAWVARPGPERTGPE